MDDAEDPASLERWETQLRKGSVGLAVLACLWSGPAYGLEILKRLNEGGGLIVPEGTIYPLLNRLKAAGLLSSQWVEAEAGHPRKYYSLTERGRRQARAMSEAWRSFAAGLDELLIPLREEAAQ